MVLGVVFEAYI